MRPTHSVKHFSANRVFTDREGSRARFLAACEKGVPLNGYKVLMWYGVGGQGKSALVREFERAAARLNDAFLHIAKVDFEDPRLRAIHDALLSLRLQLAKTGNIRFPAFDTAFARYFMLSNPGIDMRQRHPELFRRGDSEILGDLVDWSETGITRIVVEGAKDAVPGLSLLYKYSMRLHSRVREWLERRGKTVLKGLDDLRADELLEKLPTYLGADLCDAIEASPSLKPVIMFDTYEALWRDRGQRDGETARRSDLWVRRLVQDAPGVLFVLVGRDRLRWREEDEEWTAVIEEHLLGPLSDADCTTFLKAVPILEQPIRQKIIKGAKGLPFFLDLQVDLYEALKNKGETSRPAQFGGSHTQILTRLLDHLGEHEAKVLRLASYPLIVTEAGMNDLATVFLGGAAHTNWRALRERSFMSETFAGGLVMHMVLREELQRREEEERPDLCRKIHRHLFERFDEGVRPAEGQGIDSAHESAFRDAFFHKTRANPDDVFAWVMSQAPIFGRAARWATLELVLRQLLQITRPSLGEEHPDTLTTRHKLAQQVGDQGRYAEAEKEFRAIWEISRRSNVLGEEHPDTLTTRNDMALQIGRQGRYAEAETEFRAIWEIARRPDVLGEDHSETLGIRHNLAQQIGNQGRFADAEKELRAVWEIQRRPDMLGEEHPDTLMTRANMAWQLDNQGRYADAEKEYRAVWEVQRRPDVLGEEHPATLATQGNIARQICNQGRYADAEKEFRAVWEIERRPDVLGEEHPNTLTTRHNIAFQVGNQGRYADAEKEFRAVWEIRRRPDVLGEGHPETLTTLHNIAQQMGNRGRHAASEREFRALWEIERRPDVFGEEHPATLTTRHNLAYQIGNQGRHAEAEKEFRAIWEIQRRPDVLGEEHPETLSVRANIAKQIGNQGRYAEAEKEFRAVWAIQRRPDVLGEGHPNNLRNRYWIARMLDGQDRRQEASELLVGLREAMERELDHDHVWLSDLNSYLLERAPTSK